MNYDQYRTFLNNIIPTAKIVSGGSHINCRCFYCSDSKNPKSAHFYISIPSNENEPSLYYCQKCHASGVVTYKTLLEWGIYDPDIATDLINHNKKCSIKSGNNKYYQNIIYKISNKHTTENDISQYKLNYINSRIGTNLSYQDLRDLKIVLNLKDILLENHIEKLTRNESIVDQLSNNFLGFLSVDNAFLNMRRICDEGLVYKTIDKRYINYKLFDKFDTSQRFYTVPTTVDLLQQEPVKLHIAEGPFDILSVYLNCRHREPGIYTSVGGSNYLGIIYYFLENYKLPYVEVHIYPDNDQYGSNNQMNYIYNYLNSIGMEMYVHRNQYPNEKDFGIHPSHIKETVQKWGTL